MGCWEPKTCVAAVCEIYLHRLVSGHHPSRLVSGPGRPADEVQPSFRFIFERQLLNGFSIHKSHEQACMWLPAQGLTGHTSAKQQTPSGLWVPEQAQVQQPRVRHLQPILVTAYMSVSVRLVSVVPPKPLNAVTLFLSYCRTAYRTCRTAPTPIQLRLIWQRFTLTFC